MFPTWRQRTLPARSSVSLCLEILEERHLPSTINTLAGTGTLGFGGDGGPATNAQLAAPFGVALDGSGNVYIADQDNNRVRKVSPSGIITTIAGNGSGGFSGDGGQATNAQLNLPRSVAVDGQGDIFIADSGNGRVREVTPAGIITAIAGNGSFQFSGDGGPATNAGMSPNGVAVDGQGDVFIADQSNNRVREVTPRGIVTTFAGNGTAGFSGDGGQATNAQLAAPFGVACAGAGNVFIADQNNNRIRLVNSSGIITTFAGTGTAGFSGDGGQATNAQLNVPTGMASDNKGDLFIVDDFNGRIREVSPTGIITTVAGNGSGGFSGDGGEPTNASLNTPTGVAVDSSGHVYIADTGNERIRIVTLGTPQIALSAGNNQSALAGSAVSIPPSVVVTDAQGNRQAGVTVTFAVTSGGGTITGATAVTDSSGVATLGSWTLGTTAGTNTLSATCNGFAGSPLTFTATGLVGPIAQLAYATQPSTVVPGQPISPAVTLLVEDANGNIVTTDNSTVTIAIGNNPAAATLGGNTTVQVVNGRATFTGLNLNTFGTGFTLIASDGNLPALTSQPFDVLAVVLVSSTSRQLVNQPVTFTAKVFAPVPFNGNPFGQVTFSVGNTVLGTVPVDSDGRAILTTAALPLTSGSITTTNVVTVSYNDPATDTTSVTTVATSGPGVPATIVLGPGLSGVTSIINDGSPPETLAGTLQTNSPLVGQFVPASDSLDPTYGDDNLFALMPSMSPNITDLVTTFPSQFQKRSSFTIKVLSDIGLGSPASQIFTISVSATPPPPGTGGGVVHGASTLAVFDPTGASSSFAAFWYLGTANAANAQPTVVPYGGINWKGVLGDWTGKGFDSLGAVDTTGLSSPLAAFWYLRNTNTPGAADIGPFPFGLPTWTPLVGDWNGDGITTVGAVDTTTGTWYLRNENSPGGPDQGTFLFGEPGWIPLAGDWTGSGHTGIGAFDPTTATFYLRNSASAGAPDFVFQYGAPTWKPVVGDWDGNGTTTIAVVAPGNIWFIRNENSAGAPDIPPFPFGLDAWSDASGRFVSPGTPELAAGGARVSDPSTQVLTEQELQDAVTSALAQLEQMGLAPSFVNQLASACYEVNPLPGALLAVTTADGNIIVSPNAAGYGWSLATGSGGNSMDLQTVLLHEMTHLAGQPDVPGSGTSTNLLVDTLAPGVSRSDVLDAF
jgi:hypothetical protein